MIAFSYLRSEYCINVLMKERVKLFISILYFVLFTDESSICICLSCSE